MSFNVDGPASGPDMAAKLERSEPAKAAYILGTNSNSRVCLLEHLTRIKYLRDRRSTTQTL